MSVPDSLPHSLLPLALAVLLVRAKLAERTVVCGMDPNGLASFIGSAVPVFEYWKDPSRRPSALPSGLRGGMLCEGGRELRFVDGRSTKFMLAVHVDDVGSVVEMLQCPERAARIRGRVLRAHARQLVRTARELRAAAIELRAGSERRLAAQNPPQPNP